jgi:hypothetical protein
MTGWRWCWGTTVNSNEVYMQAAGQGHCIRANNLRRAIDKSVTLHRPMLRYAHAFLEQATRTAVANGRSKNEEDAAVSVITDRAALDRDARRGRSVHRFSRLRQGVFRDW